MRSTVANRVQDYSLLAEYSVSPELFLSLRPPLVSCLWCGLPSFTPRARAGAQPARSVMHREAQPKGPARGGALFSQGTLPFGWWPYCFGPKLTVYGIVLGYHRCFPLPFGLTLMKEFTVSQLALLT